MLFLGWCLRKNAKILPGLELLLDEYTRARKLGSVSMPSVLFESDQHLSESAVSWS